MISHHIMLLSLVLGVPQGAFLGARVSLLLGITGIFEIALIIGGAFLGLFIGYAEVLLAKKCLNRIC